MKIILIKILGLSFIISSCLTKSNKKEDVVQSKVDSATISNEYLEKGSKSFFNGKIEEAHFFYAKALEYNPQNLDAKYSRSTLYGFLGKNDERIRELSEIIKADSMYVESYYYRGLAYYEKKEYDKAILDFNQSLKLNYNIGDSYVMIAYSYEELGAKTDAEMSYSNAITSNPRNPKYYYLRSSFYLSKMGDTIKMCSDINKSISLGFLDSISKIDNEPIVNEVNLFMGLCKVR